MSDQIKVDFGAISGLAQGIDGQVRQVENLLDELKSQISNLESLWEGSAGSGFQQVKNNWLQSANDLNGVLARIATATHAAHDNYNATESKNAASWG